MESELITGLIGAVVGVVASCVCTAVIEAIRNYQLKKTGVYQACLILLEDRITYLVRCYVKQGYVDFDDKSRIHRMHKTYKKLGGNGDLDDVMDTLDRLEVK